MDSLHLTDSHHVSPPDSLWSQGNIESSCADVDAKSRPSPLMWRPRATSGFYDDNRILNYASHSSRHAILPSREIWMRMKLLRCQRDAWLLSARISQLLKEEKLELWTLREEKEKMSSDVLSTTYSFVLYIFAFCHLCNWMNMFKTLCKGISNGKASVSLLY